uniref:Uncharacterized protein n=1 Tax=Physcomitrium patens TaxID=3218 RepID=A9T362_PHYPA
MNFYFYPHCAWNTASCWSPKQGALAHPTTLNPYQFLKIQESMQIMPHLDMRVLNSWQNFAPLINDHLLVHGSQRNPWTIVSGTFGSDRAKRVRYDAILHHGFITDSGC